MLNWTDDDFRTLIRTCVSLNMRPEDWLCVASSESGLQSTAYNPLGGASGLTQMMPQTLRGLGWQLGDKDFQSCQGDYRNLSVDGQIRWSGKYFAALHVGQWSRPGDIYLANFLPAYLKHKDQPDFVLASQGPWYTQNAGLDHGHKGYITVEDMSIQAEKGRQTGVYVQALAQLIKVRQSRLNDVFPSLAPLQVDGVWGPQSEDRANQFRALTGDACLDRAIFATT